MFRAASLTLLAATVLAAPAWAQHGGGGHAGGGHGGGGHIAAGPGHSGLVGHRSGGHPGSRRFSGNRGAWNNYGYGGIGGYPYFLPDDWYDEAGDEPPVDSAPVSQPVVEQRIRERRPVKPVPPAQVIEIPNNSATVAKSLPPTVFVLTSGERL